MNSTISKAILGLLLLFSIHFLSEATHVVGGEIQVTWTGIGNRYTIQLNKYVNKITEDKLLQQGYGHEVERQIELTIYENVSPARFVKNILPSLYSIKPATNTSSACVNPALVLTDVQVYTMSIDLSDFTSSAGYYIVWQYCCRNEDITNIYKTSDGNQQILLFTEFPGINTRSSTPVFKTLGNEFFCRNTLNTFDYSAIDADGDQLKYSLTAPNQYSDTDVDHVYAGPKPFKEVLFVGTNISAANPIPGSVGLSIDPVTGLLSFNPSQTGTFLFGVKVEEWRNGQKIGEVHRDFQFNVQNCPVNNKPSIGFIDPMLHATDTISVNFKEEKCFKLYFTDKDALTRTEFLYPSATGGMYPASAIGLNSVITLNNVTDTVSSNICFKPCLAGTIKESGYYPITVIVRDKMCPEKFDTLLFTLRVIVPDNAIPTVTIDPAFNPTFIKVDSLLRFNVLGADTDPGDLLSLTMYGKDRAMSFKNVSDSSSTISSVFTWTPSCDDADQGIYNVYFIIKDNSCLTGHADTVYQQIRVKDNDISFDSIRITNLVTPNNDQKNDYYHIPGIPAGNCEYFFKHIEIYNRWGSRVFYSQDKSFKWYPEVTDGMYYYAIDFNKDKKAGWIQVIANP